MDPAPPPVAPPPASPYPRPNLQGDGPACPQCASTKTTPVKYTWWGGVLGPKLMNLRKCEACRFQFNESTGKGVMKAIVVYNIVVLVMVLAFLIVIRSVFLG